MDKSRSCDVTQPRADEISWFVPRVGCVVFLNAIRLSTEKALAVLSDMRMNVSSIFVVDTFKHILLRILQQHDESLVANLLYARRNVIRQFICWSLRPLSFGWFRSVSSDLFISMLQSMIMLTGHVPQIIKLNIGTSQGCCRRTCCGFNC